MPKKTPSSPVNAVGAERARQHIQTRFNPIRGLTPAKLARYLDSFWAGNLRECAILWQKIIERDDQVKTCSAKRIRATPALNYEILPVDNSPEAKTHADALKAFYNNLTAVNALDENERGGVRLLLKQMLSCIGMKYAVHEIVWAPGANSQMTATFRFIPLQFFENTTGRLRFLKSDFDVYGVSLDDFFGEGGWMVTTGDGLMEASSVAYMFKNMPLKAWVGYCEKYGTPGLHGKTGAAKGSPEWDAMVTALANFGEDLAIVTNDGASITPIEVKSAGNIPHPPLVDRMDRGLSRLWIGGDLATMSQGGSGGVGSNPQQDDVSKLRDEDAALLTDTLQAYVDKRIIEYRFGPGVAPKAYFKLSPPAEVNIDREIKIDQFLIDVGVPRGKKDLLARYNRPELAAGDEPAQARAAAPSPFPGIAAVNEKPVNARFEVYRSQALRSLSQAQAAALRPLTDRLSEILGIEDETAQDAALLKLQNDMPGLLKSINADEQLATVWQNILGTALASGAIDAAKNQNAPAK